MANLPANKSWPADKVERRPIDALIPYAKNARTHSDTQIDQIAKSIEDFGFTVPVLIGPKGDIIAGHGRVLAAKRLGLAEVPTVTADGWSDAQRRAYVILDNKLGLNSGWDADLLKAEFADLEAGGFDLGSLGFEPVELAAIRDVRPEGLTDPDEAPEPPAKPVAVRGDLWALGRHRLLCGDATSAEDVAALLDGAKPHLMVTDPPYGVEYNADWRNKALRADGTPSDGRAVGLVANDDRVDWRDAWALFPGDVGYYWHADRHASAVQQSIEASGFEVRCQVIWAKGRFAIGRGDYHWQHEPCWYAVRKGRKGHWTGSRSQSTLWEISHSKSETGHSTQKPVECMKRPIENNSQPGDGVYEPFSGSGTTIVAAEMTGRKCFAVEIMPAYVDVAIKRWQAFTGEVAKLGSRTFDEVAAERLGLAA